MGAFLRKPVTNNSTEDSARPKFVSPMPVSSSPSRQTLMISLLGLRDSPTDAVEDYCVWLARALERQGQAMEILRMPWAERGWTGAAAWLWNAARGWRGEWVLLQYTALGWSKRAVPFGVLATLFVLRTRGVRSAVVFHDAIPYDGPRNIDRIRRRLQIWIMRGAYHWSSLSILPVPLSAALWLPSSAKAAFIPVGANLPGDCVAGPGSKFADSPKTVAIFSVTGEPQAEPECARIAQIMRRAAEGLPRIRLLVLGRNGDIAATLLRSALASSSIEIEAYGVLPAEEIERKLSAADVQLFVRGGISSRRGSALAGISCGLPVVACAGAETGPPLTDAGVLLAPAGDDRALSDALRRVLLDDSLRADLRRRSLTARSQYFSFDVIAQSFLQAMKHV
jgi:glycosyltransferase involved in cell wall biosynthesis